MIRCRPRPLCAICAERTADTITDWECESGRTRTIVACWPCLSPVPDPPEEYEPVDLFEPARVAARKDPTDHATRDRILAALAKIGRGTFADLIAALGLSSGTTGRDGVGGTVRRKLSILEDQGAVAGEYLDPSNPRRGRVYWLTGAKAEAPAVRAVLAMVPSLPPVFDWRSIHRDHRTAAAAIRVMRERGAIVEHAPATSSSPTLWRVAS